jgi:hypothetical protein
MAREEGFFDELARGLADGSITRGKALRLMGAALVGGTLGSLGIREAAGDPPGCKRIGKNCTRDTQCCGSLVCPSGTCQTQTTTPTPTTSTTETPTTTTTTAPATERYICACNDGTTIDTCSSTACTLDSRVTVCRTVCASHGGLVFPGCFANDPLCAPA